MDTRAITLASLRALTGIVSQDTVLFNDTVRNNIAYGSAASFTSAQIEQAARAANAHDFISALPNGYDTVLGNVARGCLAVSASDLPSRARCSSIHRFSFSTKRRRRSTPNPSDSFRKPSIDCSPIGRCS